MADPIIRSVTTTASVLLPGQSAGVLVDAVDPDAQSVTVTARVVDSGGRLATAVTTVTVGDPLTYELTSSDPAVTIAVDPSAPGRFTVTL